jgi:hypothetical protein
MPHLCPRLEAWPGSTPGIYEGKVIPRREENPASTKNERWRGRTPRHLSFFGKTRNKIIKRYEYFLTLVPVSALGTIRK